MTCLDSYPPSLYFPFRSFFCRRDILNVVRVIIFLQSGSDMAILPACFAISSLPYFLFPVGIRGRRLAAVPIIEAQLIDQNCDQREQQRYGAFQSRGYTGMIFQQFPGILYCGFNVYGFYLHSFLQPQSFEWRYYNTGF